MLINLKLYSILLFCFFLATNFTAFSQGVSKANIWPIISRQADVLLEGDKPFRFLGLAAPNIQQNENQLRLDMSNRFPDEFEIRDLLGGLQRLGSRATRTFSLSITCPADKAMAAYVMGRRTYNEEAFKCLDRIIALCHEYDIRLIIPFIASQSFGGIRGVDEFSDLSGKPRNSFWTDDEVKKDFKHLLEFILNRKNTVNGLLYKEDPAILAWQLGNEFGSFAGDRKMDYNEWSPKILTWCLEMAAYIKKIDPKHLIMDAGGVDRKALIADKNIDVISDHLYEYWSKMSNQPWQLGPIAKASRLECKGKKALIIDEFGLGSYENIQDLIKTIGDENISGGLLWSIRSHRRDGGWYYHNEGGTYVNSFHVPGFPVGFAYDEIRMLDLLRNEAYKIRGLVVAPIQKPTPAPVLFSYNKGFTWRGATGAASYTIERADEANGPWLVLAVGLHDSVIADAAKFEASPESAMPLVLFNDESAVTGKTYFYRIKAVNVAGDSDYSPVLKLSL